MGSGAEISQHHEDVQQYILTVAFLLFDSGNSIFQHETLKDEGRGCGERSKCFFEI